MIGDAVLFSRYDTMNEIIVRILFENDLDICPLCKHDNSNNPKSSSQCRFCALPRNFELDIDQASLVYEIERGADDAS
jgi:hypothetical protein